MAGLTLDSGALIGAEKNSRRVWAYLKEATLRGTSVAVPAGVLAQTWKGRNARIASILKGADVEALDEARAKQIGVILTRAGVHDVVDGSVVVGAAQRGDAILTSDASDLRRIADAIRSNRPRIISV